MVPIADAWRNIIRRAANSTSTPAHKYSIGLALFIGLSIPILITTVYVFHQYLCRLFKRSPSADTKFQLRHNRATPTTRRLANIRTGCSSDATSWSGLIRAFVNKTSLSTPSVVKPSETLSTHHTGSCLTRAPQPVFKSEVTQGRPHCVYVHPVQASRGEFVCADGRDGVVSTIYPQGMANDSYWSIVSRFSYWMNSHPGRHSSSVECLGRPLLVSGRSWFAYRYGTEEEDGKLKSLSTLVRPPTPVYHTRPRLSKRASYPVFF